MPKVEDIFSKLNEAKYFTTLDLRARYHHIPLDTSSILKTAFNSSFGKYGVCQNTIWISTSACILPRTDDQYPKRFQICNSLFGWHHKIQQNPRRNLTYIRQVFEKLCSTKLSMKLSKCHFFSKEIQYLGHILSTMGIHPLPSKNTRHTTDASTNHP